MTDNPDFDTLRAIQLERHGLSIAYIKKRVGAGTEYANEVANAVLSEQGGYYQLSEMPEEFAGALGTGVSHRLIAPLESLALLARIQVFVESILAGAQPVRAVSLYALYAGGSLRVRREMFVLDQKPGEAPFSHGQWQPDTLPRFLKLRLDCGDLPAPSGLGLSEGVLFLLTPQHRDDGHVLLGTLTRTPGTQDLSMPKMPSMMH
ncbi:MAG: hypothetical protein ACRYFS_21615 [Janthinobacterium lividum]